MAFSLAKTHGRLRTQPGNLKASVSRINGASASSQTEPDVRTELEQSTAAALQIPYHVFCYPQDIAEALAIWRGRFIRRNSKLKAIVARILSAAYILCFL